jgi:hypothetical protein
MLRAQKYIDTVDNVDNVDQKDIDSVQRKIVR